MNLQVKFTIWSMNRVKSYSNKTEDRKNFLN